MTDKKVWFITGAGRGLGVDITKSAAAAGNAVVATGRNTEAVAKAVGEVDDLLVIKLDITSREAAEAAVRAAVERFGLEGWMESLHSEVAPFGIHTTIVDPGFFRTALLTKESATYAEPSLEDYADRRAEQLGWWEAQNGQQPGDPAKLARALVTIAGREQPPRRFSAGADAIALAEQKVADLQAQIDADRDLSTSLALGDARP